VKVEVRLYAALVEHLDGVRAGDPVSVEIPEGMTLAGLLWQLGIAEDVIHLALVNGRPVRGFSTALAANDQIGLFPPVGGG
jgi:molybdopterin synthase sulfur carrier subunit